MALSQGPQFGATSADGDEKDQEGILRAEDCKNNEQLNKFNYLLRMSEKNKGEILTLGEHTNHLAQEKGKHQSQAGTNQHVKRGKLKKEGSRDCELQNQVETAGQFELTATGQSALSEAEHQEELEQNQYEWAAKRGEQLQVTELHHQSVELNQQEQTRMTEQIDEFYEQDKYLREQQQLDIQLQSQLETKQQELVTRMREQLDSFLGQKDLLREERQEQPQLTAELHNHLEIYQHDWTTEAGQVNGIQGKEELITEETQPFFETNLQKVKTGLTRLKEQLNALLAKDELVREEEQQIADLQNKLTRMREKSNEFHGQDEILRQEQQRVSVLRNQLETKKRELTTLRKTELDESMEYETLLKVERQRRNELQSQLETNRRNIALTRKQMYEYEKQDEFLREERQRVTELENQLETSRHDLG